MQDLFVTVLKMSLTASYVILAVLLIRLLLQKAPKKYAYLLWIAVGFRLVFPQSFTFDFSLLRLKELFSSTDPAEMAAGSGMLSTSAIEPSSSHDFNTPTEAPIFSGTVSGNWNPIPGIVSEGGASQPQWVMLAALLWLAGIVVLLTYCGVALYKIKRKTATAIKVEGNIYESDAIYSPFILGLFNPRIYMPFGLGQAEKAYILMHEKYHLRRRDHWIQPIAFLLLAVHWFNPLVWAAYIWMTRDMEMSCDEKVLTEAGPGISKPYSLSLLSFAANRRIPMASPLAFGESSVRKRIKNVLSFKKANKWVSAAAALLTVMAIVACTADPGVGGSSKRLQAENGSGGASGTTGESEVQLANEDQMEAKIIAGTYRFDKKLYLNPLSSFYPGTDFVEYYTFSENSFIITDHNGEQTQLSARYEQTEVEPEAFIEAYGKYALKSLIPDINAYQTRLQYDLDRIDGQPDFYRLYIMDGEMWFAHFLNDAVWTLYQIVPYYGNLPMKKSVDTGEVRVISGDYQIKAVRLLDDVHGAGVSGPQGFPSKETRDKLEYLVVDTSEKRQSIEPFTVMRGNAEQFGRYALYDAESGEQLDVVMPSGLKPQTYLFQQSEPGRSYIVELIISEESNDSGLDEKSGSTESVYLFGVIAP